MDSGTTLRILEEMSPGKKSTSSDLCSYRWFRTRSRSDCSSLASEKRNGEVATTFAKRSARST